MLVTVRVALVGFNGEPVETGLALEAYDLLQNAWLPVETLLKGYPITLRFTFEQGRHQAVFTLKEAAFLEVFGTTAFFRLVVASARDGAAAQVILAEKHVVSDTEKLEVDFGTVLLLGEGREFSIASGTAGSVCAGVMLASDDPELAAAQRRFYTWPHEIDEIVVERDQARARVAELEAAAAAGEKTLAECQARGAKLTRNHAALTKKWETAAAGLAACASQRASLSEQVKALTERAATTEADLTACAAERTRLGDQFTAAAADLKVCVTERKALDRQLKAQTARLAEAGAGLKACGEESAALEAKLTDLSERLAGADAGLKACAEARTQLEAQAAEAAKAFAVLSDQLERAAGELNRCREARGKAETELAACGDRATALEDQAKAAAGGMEAAAVAAAAAEAQAAAIEQARQALVDRALVLEAELALRAAELEELRRGEHGEDVETVRMREKLAAMTAQAQVATGQLEALRTQTRLQIPTGQVFESLAKSLHGAQTALAAADNPIRIGRTDITLKALVGGGGEFLYLADAASHPADAALSEVKVELIPNESPPLPAEGELLVPDVLGLTETAVVRVLSSLFLKAEKAVETVTGAPDKHGRALRQIPRPGAPAVRGQTVLVVYGAESP